MNVPLNFVAIVIATLAAMVIGYLWYGPLFGKYWRRLSGLDTKAAPKPQVIYPITLVASFATAWSLAWVGGATGVNTVVVAAILWLGFSASRALIVTLFEARPIRLFLINTGHNLAVALAMAVIISVMGI
ncbi:DUF1761 domain-containing protein [Microbacterium sp. NPDC076911]|uniref:DUF1761 domain-containing protein n=1 Tax=Microbacterium sp. NPDC076911 TaxID=3154958 RepID=UPI003422AC98